MFTGNPQVLVVQQVAGLRVASSLIILSADSMCFAMTHFACLAQRKSDSL